MGQITTYSKPTLTEADVRAAGERAREERARKKAEEEATLNAAIDEETLNRARAMVLEDMASRGTNKPDTEAVETEKADRQDREIQLQALVDEQKRSISTFYRGMSMAIGAATSDIERGPKAAKLADDLGVSNPITSSVMQLGDSTGVIQDKVIFVEKLMEKFAKRYRATGGQLSIDLFEKPGWS